MRTMEDARWLVLFAAVGCSPDTVAPADRDGQRADGALSPLHTNSAARLEGFEQRVVYLVMPDRFANGDPSNDDQGDGCTDPDDPRKFHGGDWRGIVDRLDYLEDLGVDALWITPPYRQVGRVGNACGYHGYWGDFTTPDDGGVDPHLGTPDDLRDLSDALHARDMVLVLDLVVNHAGPGAPLARERPDWFHDDSDCHGSPRPDEDCALHGLPDFDQDHPDADAWLTTHTTRWVQDYDIDAVRLDTVKHLPTDWLRDRWLPAVNADRERFVIAEVYEDGDYHRVEEVIDAGFPSAFDFPLRRALVDTVARGGSVDLLASRVREVVDRFGIEQANRMVHMLDNHDVPRFAEEVLARPQHEETGRYRLGLAILFTAPGIPQLTWGSELGMRGTGDPDNRRDMPDWAWEASTRTGDPDGFLQDMDGTFRTVRALADLRRAHPALTIGSYAELWRQNGHGPAVWAFFRGEGADRVVVAVHTGIHRSGPLRMNLQTNPDIGSDDKAALQDGVPLVPALPVDGLGGARIDGGQLVIDDIPPLTAAVWRVGG